ncbi:hypothetical protein GC176_14605 [bacterium]|nr:hypothetical protein [bacterium]
MRRLLLPLLLATVCASVILFLAIRDRGAPSEAVPPTGRTTEQQRRTEPSAASRVAQTTDDARLTPDGMTQPQLPGGTQELSPELARRSSWTNPYGPSLWQAAGWRFAEDSMSTESLDRSTAETYCTAEFLREWNTFSVGLTVDFAKSSGASDETSHQLVLEVVDRSSGDSLRVTLQPDRAAADSVQSGQAVLLREIPLADDFEFGRVGLLLTPNRLLVRGNDRLLLNVTRPSALIGQRCRFRILAPLGTTIRELRFDGE